MIASFSANSWSGNAAIAATPHPSVLRAATFPKGEGVGWFDKLQFCIPSSDTERVREVTNIARLAHALSAATGRRQTAICLFAAFGWSAWKREWFGIEKEKGCYFLPDSL